MSKRCIHCGVQLPDAASFCPICATAQTARECVTGPRLWRKKALFASLVLLVLSIAGLVIYEPEPQHLEGVGQVVYQDGKDIYQITVCINPSKTEQPWAATPEISNRLDPDDSFRYPAQLLIYRNGYDPAIQEEFLSKLASCTVSATPLTGGVAMECTIPAASENFPQAALVSHITYTAANLRNQITWNFLMQNGDTITITHIVDVSPLETMHIYSDQEPMNDSEQLSALMEKIYQEIDPDTIVYLHLPPVTYDQLFVLERRTVNLIGSSDGKNRTTFTQGVVINTVSPSMVCMENLFFAGNGGHGVETHHGVAVKGCTFTGWDIALFANDGGSVGVERCVFRENQIGIKYDTGSYRYFRGDYSNCVFENNSIGVWTARMPGDHSISFPETIFSQNGVDIQNDSGNMLDLSKTIFE